MLKTKEKILISVSKLIRPLPTRLKILLLWIVKDHPIPLIFPIDISGAKMDLNLGYFVDFWIFANGTYEGNWIRQVKNLANKKTFIDVGAHIGIYTLSLFRDAETVFAFEPEKNNFKRLRRHIKLNSAKNIKTYRKAVSDKQGLLVNLYINEVNDGMHSTTVSYDTGQQRVKTITLDYFVNRHKVKNIGLIKIDVEGAELKVLKGATNTLRRLHPPILIEFNKTLAETSGHKLMDIYRLLTKCNYGAYRLRRNRLIRINASIVRKPVRCNRNGDGWFGAS